MSLIEAAQGRALALFTSWRAMKAAADVVRQRVPWKILTQSDLPKPKLVDVFSSDEHSCLFATMGFWQGVDVPGPSLSLVTIDRLPFPRPDDPLLRARRDALGAASFRTDRRAASGHPPGPGCRPSCAFPRRPRRGGRLRPALRESPLPLGAGQLVAAYAANEIARRSGDVPQVALM